jgi:hypothetical protein
MGSRPVILCAVRRVRAICHLEREEYEKNNKKNYGAEKLEEEWDENFGK